MPTLLPIDRKVNHRIKPKDRCALIGVAVLSLFLSGCVTKTRYQRDIQESYAKGSSDTHEAMIQDIERGRKEIESLRESMNRPRDSKGRFIKVNGQTVDLEGK